MRIRKFAYRTTSRWQQWLATFMPPVVLAVCCLNWLGSESVWGQFRDVTPRDEPNIPAKDDPAPSAFTPVTDGDAPYSESNRPPTHHPNHANSEIPRPRSDDAFAVDEILDDPVEADQAELARQRVLAAERERLLKEEQLRQQQEQIEQEIEETLIDDTEIRPLPFRRITAGLSTEDDLIDLWGEPFKESTHRRERVLKYRLEPFRQVDVHLARGVVKTILIHLDGLMSPEQVETELRMTRLRPATVNDDYGRPIGLVYPERGVLLSYDFSDPDAMIAKIQLEAISVEAFLLRAANDRGQRYESNLADLQKALDLDPENALAYWLRAKQFALAGRYHDALACSARATNFDPENLEYRLSRIELMHVNGNREMALRETKMILEQSDISTHLRAAIIQLLGELLAAGENGAHKAAMEQQLKAIELAAKLVNDPEHLVRRSAKMTLIRAHLAVARNISLGKFQKQKDVVPKWLGRARALIDDFVDQERGDRLLYLDLYRQILATAADIQNEEDPTYVLQELQMEATSLIDSAKDPLFRNSIEWKLGAALAEAVRLQRQRGEDQSALTIAKQAMELLKTSAKRRQSTPEQTYLIGRLHFHVGSLHAVYQQDHDEAVSWYRRAEPLLSGERPVAGLADPAAHGEMFVSMGVSYWETGDRQKAIDITEFGTDYLQRAVVEGFVPVDVLSIPYNNLASMHNQHGNAEEARAFAELAEEVEKQRQLR